MTAVFPVSVENAKEIARDASCDVGNINAKDQVECLVRLGM